MSLKLSPRNWASIRNSKLRARPFPGTPTKFQPIQPVAFRVDTPLCIVLLSSNDVKYNWWLAGWVQAYMYSGAFVSRQFISLNRWTLGLDRPALLDFKQYGVNMYALEFTFPKWHKSMKLQAWKYVNPITDATDVDIQAVKDQINRLESKIDDMSAYN